MKVSIIVLSWNGIAHLVDALAALQSHASPGPEIIVVDNASTDGSAEFVESHYPAASLLRNSRNLGFAAGNNRGLKVATGDVLVLLNQDTIVGPGWLNALLAELEINPRVGVVGAKALFPDGRIQHAGGCVDVRGEATHYGYRQLDEGQFDEARDVDYVTGASLAISRAAYEAVGELDEGFGLAYYEDVDWCYRAREAGFGVRYTPKAVLVHKESGSGVSGDHEGFYRFHRNRLRFVLKHWHSGQLVGDFAPAECQWLESLGEGGEQLIAAVHHAYLYHLLHLEELAALRSSTPGSNADDAEIIARLLLLLRTTFPLKPARARASLPSGQEAGGGSSRADLLARLHELRIIRERPASSRLPIVGGLLTALRGPWNRAVTAAYVLPMMHQQAEFNVLVAALLEEVSRYRLNGSGRLDEVLLEYLREAAREIGELAQEVQRLRALLEQDRPHP